MAMQRPDAATTTLALLMLLVGGGALFACELVPAWLEYREARQVLAAAQRQYAQLEQRLIRVNKQLEHLERDPAYVERLARQDFGLHTPGVERIRIDVSAKAGQANAEGRMPAGTEPAGAPAQHNPLVAVFVLEQTRPILAGLSAGMVLIALLLLSVPRRVAKPASDRQARPAGR